MFLLRSGGNDEGDDQGSCRNNPLFNRVFFLLLSVSFFCRGSFSFTCCCCLFYPQKDLSAHIRCISFQKNAAFLQMNMFPVTRGNGEQQNALSPTWRSFRSEQETMWKEQRARAKFVRKPHWLGLCGWLSTGLVGFLEVNTLLFVQINRARPRSPLAHNRTLLSHSGLLQCFHLIQPWFNTSSSYFQPLSCFI